MKICALLALAAALAAAGCRETPPPEGDKTPANAGMAPTVTPVPSGTSEPSVGSAHTTPAPAPFPGTPPPSLVPTPAPIVPLVPKPGA